VGAEFALPSSVNSPPAVCLLLGTNATESGLKLVEAVLNEEAVWFKVGAEKVGYPGVKLVAYPPKFAWGIPTD
jgi:hypothetical protein